jgi:hypothetical protein
VPGKRSRRARSTACIVLRDGGAYCRSFLFDNRPGEFFQQEWIALRRGQQVWHELGSL